MNSGFLSDVKKSPIDDFISLSATPVKRQPEHPRTDELNSGTAATLDYNLFEFKGGKAQAKAQTKAQEKEEKKEKISKQMEVEDDWIMQSLTGEEFEGD
jgi:hypothetical protein